MQIDRLIRTKRKTVAIQIQPDGSLWVRAPLRASLQAIQALLEAKAAWIRSHQEQARQTAAAASVRRYVNGELFEFLGKAYPLALVEAGSPPLRLGERFYLSERALPQAAQVFETWYRAQARIILGGRAAELAQQHGLAFTRLRIMAARTRWGSCGAGGSLNLNWRLVLAPPDVIDYVIIHELAHLKVHNHSPLFWAEVARMLPGYKAPRAWLKTHGKKLTTP